jgi:hypothetical protein
LCCVVLCCAHLCSPVLTCAHLCSPVLACARLCSPVLTCASAYNLRRLSCAAGAADGVQVVWLNAIQVGEWRSLKYIANPDEHWIERLLFHNYHGGSTDDTRFWPSHNQFIWCANLMLHLVQWAPGICACSTSKPVACTPVACTPVRQAVSSWCITRELWSCASTLQQGFRNVMDVGLKVEALCSNETGRRVFH